MAPVAYVLAVCGLQRHRVYSKENWRIREELRRPYANQPWTYFRSIPICCHTLTFHHHISALVAKCSRSFFALKTIRAHASMEMHCGIYSGAFPQKDTANCDTSTKIGTNERHTMLINLRPGGILEVNAFCQNLTRFDMAADHAVFI